MGKSLLWGVAAGGVAVGLVLVALGKKGEQVPIAPAASALAPSVASAAPAAALARYTLDPGGKTAISMPAPKEHIKAQTEAAQGTLDVDLADLRNTRGEVKVDLTTLSTHTFGNDDDASQTKHARNWLEVGDVASAEDREKYRYIVYAIRSIEDASATDASKIAPQRNGADDVRVVTLTAKGDLLLHGHKVEGREAKIQARLHYPPGAPANSRPGSIEITSAEPLRVILAEHDVKPRDPFGKLALGSLGILGTKVANVADVSIDFKAVPGAS